MVTTVKVPGIANMLRTILLLTLLSAGWYTNAAVLATVSSDHIQEGQTVEFTLQTDQVNVEADFDLLKVNFDIVNSRQSTTSRFGFNTGNVQITEWQLTLSPKATGVLRIPPITVGKDKSESIDVTVSPLSSDQKAELKKRMFIDVVVPKKTVYVDENLIVSVKFYYQDTIQGAWGDVNVNNAIFESYGNDTRSTITTQGRSYQVVEQKYRLKVLTPGPFDLPIFSVSGEYRDRDTQRWTRFSVQSDPLSVKVLDVPASWPKGQPWLPASHVELSESWVGLKPSLAIGDNLTRTIRLYVEGQDKSSQTTFDMPGNTAFKIYRDTPQIDESQATSGPAFSQTETWALVPSQGGQVSLPETDLYWWDVNSNEIHKETLAAHDFNIAANAAATNNTQTVKPVLQSAPEPAAPKPVIGPTNSNPTAPVRSGFNPWMLATAIMVLIWLATLFYFLWRRPTAITPEKTRKNPKTEKSIKLLERHCKEDKLPQVIAILVAAMNEHSGRRFITIHQALSCSNNPEFNRLVEDMLKFRYSSQTQPAPDISKLPALLKHTAFEPETDDSQSYSDILYG